MKRFINLMVEGSDNKRINIATEYITSFEPSTDSLNGPAKIYVIGREEPIYVADNVEKIKAGLGIKEFE